MNTNLNSDDLAKVKNLIDTGVVTKTEIKDLQDSFKDTLNEVCDELNLDKGLIRKAISLSFKASQKGTKDQLIEEAKEALEEISHLLDSVGRK